MCLQSTKVPRTCATCGKEFSVQPSRAAKGRGQYCSLACRAHQPRKRHHPYGPRKEVPCQACGKTVLRSAAATAESGRIFCSKRCANQSVEPAVQRFWKRVRKTETCWLWTGKPGTGGYGHLASLGVHHLAHRFSWEVHNGPIPDGLQVNHKCDVPICVRPDHLYLGTQAENMHDKKVRGRAARGERAPKAKLTADQVIEIRVLARSGQFSIRAIARQFGVWPTSIERIVTGKSWKHVPL